MLTADCSRLTSGLRSGFAVELLDRRRRRLALFLELCRYLLSRLQHAQNISVGEFGEVRVAPSSTRQLRENRGKSRNVFETDDVFRDSVEVGSDSDVVDAGDLPHVLDVIGHLGDRRLRTRV